MIKITMPIIADAPDAVEDGELPRGMRCRGGLYFSPELAPKPVFAIAYESYIGDISTGGAGYEKLLDTFPEMEDVVALVGADIDGSPMDALDNGWRLLGFTGTLAYDPRAVGRHFRIQAGEADLLFNEIMTVLNTVVGIDGQPVLQAGRDYLGEWIGEQSQRWKADAQSAIEAHDLVVYGGHYAPDEVASDG